MLLCVDIGNSFIKVAGVEDYNIAFKFVIATKGIDNEVQLYDFFNERLMGIVKTKKLNKLCDIDDVAISSVVPDLTNKMVNVIKKRLAINPFIIDSCAKTGISLKVDEPTKVGNDRLCDMAYIAHKYDGLLVTVDVGTAIVLNIIDNNKNFLGGSIFPGLYTSVRSLSANAAQIFDIELTVPDTFIGKSTKDNLNIGIVGAAAGGIEKIVNNIEKQFGDSATLIFTGGSAELIMPLINHDLIHEENMTINGMEFIYKLNHQK